MDCQRRKPLHHTLDRRPPKPEMLAQRVPAVLGAESAEALQDRYDMIGECDQIVRQGRTHDGEPVDGPGVLPIDHVRCELLGRADEMSLPGSAADVLSDLTQRPLRAGARGSVKLVRASRRS